MQITVTIPDELAAQARGLALDHYLPKLLAEDLAAEPASETIDASQPSSRHDAKHRNAAVDIMMQFAEKHGFTTGGQDLKSMVHEGHRH